MVLLLKYTYSQSNTKMVLLFKYTEPKCNIIVDFLLSYTNSNFLLKYIPKRVIKYYNLSINNH